VGAKHGMIAFIFGLALNGWAETARYVQEQTRLIKQQPYMEAARAMGGSTGDMLIRHVLRQIMPAVWMMLAFEISGTMLVSAELGFLGYYIGGGMWIEVQDFVAVNITDLPELGQMLGTALVNITRPETLLVTGGMIFIVILGFNLLGDGLRTRLQVDRIEPSSFLSDLGERLNIWLDAITPQQDTPRWRWGVVFLVADLTAVMALACWLLVHLPAVVQVPKPAAVPLANTSPHPWPMERHDPQGTLYTPIVGPQNPAIRWIFQDAAGFVGGPVVAKDGTIYQLSKAQLLYALSPQGKVLRQVPLDEPPVGSPALGKGGVIYVVGSKGGISAYKPDGSRLWVLPSPAGIATSGPVVASDGTIYYAIIDTVRAVSPEGVLVGFWQIAKSMSDYPPRLSPDGQWLLLHEAGASRTGGTPLNTLALKDDTAQFSDPNFVVGADGFVYYRTGHGLTRMQVTGNIAESLARVSWDPKGIIQAYPADAGVSPNGWAWLLYSDEYSDTEIIWIHTGSLTVKILRLPVRGLRVVGVDQQDTLYGCTRSFAQSTCYALRQDKTKPLWSLDLENTDRLAGAALLEGTLYVATQDGTLYALEDPQP
jgi:outer membrane protein assembly factor BamB